MFGDQWVGPEDRVEAAARVIYEHAHALYAEGTAPGECPLPRWERESEATQEGCRTYARALAAAGLLAGHPTPPPTSLTVRAAPSDPYGTEPFPGVGP